MQTLTCINLFPLLSVVCTQCVFLSAGLVKAQCGGKLHAANGDYSYYRPHTHTHTKYTQRCTLKVAGRRVGEPSQSIRIAEKRQELTLKYGYLDMTNKISNVISSVAWVAKVHASVACTF